MVLWKGPTGWRFLMSEEPRYVGTRPCGDNAAAKTVSGPPRGTLLSSYTSILGDI